LYGLFSAVVTVTVFGYLLTHVSLGEVMGVIRDADIRWIAVFILLSLSMSVFRTWRYGLALGVSGHAPGNVALFLVTLVRNFFSDLIPMRAGSLIYVYIVTSRLGIPFGAAASSFALAMLFDFMAIAPMIALAVLLVGAGMNLSVPGLVAAGVGLVAVVGAVLHWLPNLARFGGIVARGLPIPGRTRRDRWRAWVSKTETDTVEAVVQARRSGIYTRLFVLSVGVRVAKYGALYCLLVGLLMPLGYALSEISIPKVFLAICSSEMAASTPVSGIAGFGAYEGVWAAVFALLGFPERIAQLTSISHHLLTQVFGYSLGALALIVLMIPFFKARGAPVVPPRNGGKTVRFYGRFALAWLAVLGVLLGAFLGLTAVMKLSDNGSGGPPPSVRAASVGVHSSGGTPAPASTGSLPIPGLIVFDSNRGGTFGIFGMRPDGSDIRPIVDSGMTEIYPDPSPDGRWIAFARAKSPHRLAPSQVLVCRPDGSHERILSEDGTFPTFSSDGKTVYFERNRRIVMAVGIDGGDEREIFPGENESFGNYRAVKPRVSPDGSAVAFISDKKGRWNSWMVELASGNALHLGKGCEPAWFPGGKRLVWVKGSGTRQGSGMYAFDRKTGKSAEFHDDGPPFGHEYFPTLSRDGRLLLWGACPEGQHAHETSNYQLFAKDLAKGTVSRLTCDPFCNRWPKILAPEVNTE